MLLTFRRRVSLALVVSVLGTIVVVAGSYALGRTEAPKRVVWNTDLMIRVTSTAGRSEWFPAVEVSTCVRVLTVTDGVFLFRYREMPPPPNSPVYRARLRRATGWLAYLQVIGRIESMARQADVLRRTDPERWTKGLGRKLISIESGWPIAFVREEGRVVPPGSSAQAVRRTRPYLYDVVREEARILWGPVAALALVIGLSTFGVLSLYAATRRLLRRRAGRCPDCAYDLGGLTSPARCPECGSAASVGVHQIGAVDSTPA